MGTRATSSQFQKQPESTEDGLSNCYSITRTVCLQGQPLTKLRFRSEQKYSPIHQLFQSQTTRKHRRHLERLLVKPCRRKGLPQSSGSEANSQKDSPINQQIGKQRQCTNENGSSECSSLHQISKWAATQAPVRLEKRAVTSPPAVSATNRIHRQKLLLINLNTRHGQDQQSSG